MMWYIRYWLYFTPLLFSSLFFSSSNIIVASILLSSIIAIQTLHFSSILIFVITLSLSLITFHSCPLFSLFILIFSPHLPSSPFIFTFLPYLLALHFIWMISLPLPLILILWSLSHKILSSSIKKRWPYWWVCVRLSQSRTKSSLCRLRWWQSV